jgi:antitoxin (DNA-binding transcriptional repressor) of toxin-antitoxin stability system
MWSWGAFRSKTINDSGIKTVSIEEFELNCLEMIDLVEEKGYTYVITKAGRPFVMMEPVAAETSENPAERD